MANEWGISPLGSAFLKKQEGYRSKPYWDVRQWSTGYGTRAAGPNDTVDQAEADRRLMGETSNVSNWLKSNISAPLNEQQEDALISFGYNLGTDDLDKLKGDINSGAWDRVGKRMLTFNKAGGVTNDGLINRRAAEVQMLTGQNPNLAQVLAGTTMQPQQAAGPMPVQLPSPPSGRRSKLADMLMQRALSSQPRGWGDALNSLSAAFVGSQLGDKHDSEEKSYRSKLAEALMGAKDADALTNTLLSSGDPQLQNSAVSLKVAQMKPKSEIGRFRPTKQGVVDTTTGQIVPGTEAKGIDQAEYGTSTKAFEDKDGNLQYTQFSKAGGHKAVELPPGARWRPDVEIKDTGTEFVPVSKQTGKVVGDPIAKDVAGEAAQKTMGKEAGEATVALPAAKSMVENAFKTIAELERHPGLEAGTGLSNVIDPRSWTPGTDAYNFLAKNKQAMGQSFMTARDSLKGAGQVTDFEGAKGEQAIANLDAAQSREQYLSALNNLKTMMQASYDDLNRKAGMAGGGQAQPVAPQKPDVNALKQKYGLE